MKGPSTYSHYKFKPKKLSDTDQSIRSNKTIKYDSIIYSILYKATPTNETKVPIILETKKNDKNNLKVVSYSSKVQFTANPGVQTQKNMKKNNIRIISFTTHGNNKHNKRAKKPSVLTKSVNGLDKWSPTSIVNRKKQKFTTSLSDTTINMNVNVPTKPSNSTLTKDKRSLSFLSFGLQSKGNISSKNQTRNFHNLSKEREKRNSSNKLLIAEREISLCEIDHKIKSMCLSHDELSSKTNKEIVRDACLNRSRLINLIRLKKRNNLRINTHW